MVTEIVRMHISRETNERLLSYTERAVWSWPFKRLDGQSEFEFYETSLYSSSKFLL